LSLVVLTHKGYASQGAVLQIGDRASDAVINFNDFSVFDRKVLFLAYLLNKKLTASFQDEGVLTIEGQHQSGIKVRNIVDYERPEEILKALFFPTLNENVTGSHRIQIAIREINNQDALIPVKRSVVRGTSEKAIVANHAAAEAVEISSDVNEDVLAVSLNESCEVQSFSKNNLIGSIVEGLSFNTRSAVNANSSKATPKAISSIDNSIPLTLFRSKQLLSETSGRENPHDYKFNYCTRLQSKPPGYDEICCRQSATLERSYKGLS
jgi:hypothetical protein